MMPVFMCRWPNGDLSFVAAPNEEVAAQYLDEWDAVEPKHLQRVEHFAAFFKLNDDGELGLKEFGEQMWDQLDEQYPLIEAARNREVDGSDLSQEELTRLMAEAVEQEKRRVKWPSETAKTAEGRMLQDRMGMSASVADSTVEKHDKED